MGTKNIYGRISTKGRFDVIHRFMYVNNMLLIIPWFIIFKNIPRNVL